MAFILISGMTCSGKTTLANLLQKRGYKRVITTTTREPRVGEVDGVDYYFVTHEAFMKANTNGEIIEYNKHGEYYYGISQQELWKHIKNLDKSIIVLDVNGLRKMRNYMLSNNIPHVSCYLEVNTKVAIDRLTARYDAKEIDRANLIDRLATIATIESKWEDRVTKGEEARCVDCFVEQVDEQTVNFIANHIDRLKKLKKHGNVG